MCPLSCGSRGQVALLRGQLYTWHLALTFETSYFELEMKNVDSVLTRLDFYFVCLFKGFWIKWRIRPSYPYHCCIWPFLYFPRANSTGKFLMYKECFSFHVSISINFISLLNFVFSPTERKLPILFCSWKFSCPAFSLCLLE